VAKIVDLSDITSSINESSDQKVILKFHESISESYKDTIYTILINYICCQIPGFNVPLFIEIMNTKVKLLFLLLKNPLQENLEPSLYIGFYFDDYNCLEEISQNLSLENNAILLKEFFHITYIYDPLFSYNQCLMCQDPNYISSKTSLNFIIKKILDSDPNLILNTQSHSASKDISRLH
jgi:hypothetical protein